MTLQTCNDFLKSEDGFPENWINCYSFGAPATMSDSISKIQIRINSVVNTLFTHLNSSLITGEYINVESTKEHLENISKTIEAVPSSLELNGSPSDIQHKLSEELLFHFANPINSVLKDYRAFIHSLKRNLTILPEEQSVLFEGLSVEQFFSFNKNNIVVDTQKLSRVFMINLALAKIDHNLSVKKEILNQLILLRTELVQTVGNSRETLDKIIIDKCNYLIKKILYRFEEDAKNYLYAYDFEDKVLKVDGLEINYYKEFDEITSGHYELRSSNASMRKEWLNSVYTKITKGECLTYQDYHVATKEYKDSSKNLMQLKNLKEKFRKLYKQKREESSSISLFDKKALNISYNYILNNYFSLYLELGKDKVGVEEAEKKYERIKQVQEETGIKNYFPCMKFCHFLTKRLDILVKTPDIDCEYIRSIINRLENTLKDFYNNFEICKDRNFLSFQLPNEECIIKVEGHSVFLSSSFVLPLNYEKIQRELKELTSKLEKYKILLEVHLNLQFEKSAIKDLRENIEKNDRRSIEILGIFAAVVLFTSSSVQIFSINGVTFRDALKFMLCYSYSLTLFIFLIWLITRENIVSPP